MMASTPWVSRRRRALHAAADLLNELNVDQEEPIDIFNVMDFLDLRLVFAPLAGLLGAVLPTGGVMLTTTRQPSIQRYTAAHEVAHWVLDHNPTSFDTEGDIFHPGNNERERLAQFFASYFLMPPPLVHSTINRYGVSKDQPPTPVQAYLIARDMRVSYEAALWQMVNLRLLSDRERSVLMTVSPLQSKTQLTHGHQPLNGKADVWVVNGQAFRQHVEVVVEDEIVIGLPENRTTGYRWLDSSADADRTERTAKPEPVAFAPTKMQPTEKTSSGQSHPKSARDITAALRLLSSASPTAPIASSTISKTLQEEDLQIVSDEYQADHNDLSSRSAAQLRRALAGATLPPTAHEKVKELAGGAEPIRVAATGKRWVVLRANNVGQFTYLLHYAAPHNPVAPPAVTFTLEADVRPNLEIANRRRLIQTALGGDPWPSGDTNHSEDEADP